MYGELKYINKAYYWADMLANTKLLSTKLWLFCLGGNTPLHKSTIQITSYVADCQSSAMVSLVLLSVFVCLYVVL